MFKKIFKKKTSKADSKKTSTKKKGAKKKKIIKSTEKAVKKKMAPTKKTKYVEDSESDISTHADKADVDELPGTDSLADAVSNANNLVDEAANGSKPTEGSGDLASGKKNA